MNVIDCIRKGTFFLDGGTGSILQQQGLQPGELPETWNLKYPERIISLHRNYYEAGSHAVLTNTFGANALKFDGRNGRATVEEIVSAAVFCAKEAKDSAGGGQEEKFVALDIGPLGRLLKPAGDIGFEEAVKLFSRVVRAGAKAGVDFIFIETMSDSRETKAAVLAAKENSSCPVFASNVYGANGKMLNGADPEAMIAMLEGLGVAALGMNCSLGPEKMLELLPSFLAASSVPVIVKPNAGMPRLENGAPVYDISPEEFTFFMESVVRSGAAIVGGCCGTTPEHIREMVRRTEKSLRAAGVLIPRTVVSSGTKAVFIDEAPVLIGESINPTGRKELRKALLAGDMEYVLSEALSQKNYGAHVLDVNAGVPGADEAAILTECIEQIQSVCDIPLQIDTSNFEAMERSMRVYDGKPLINSINGSEKSMDGLFPLIKKYGGVAVCLTLDEKGIPQTAFGRYEIARRILKKAQEYGISSCDLLFDPLALAVSSEPEAAGVALEAISLISERLGCGCILGVSNISFGLPDRENLNAVFLAAALAQGLQAAIVNPASARIRDTYYAHLALYGFDQNCLKYIGHAESGGAYVGSIREEVKIKSPDAVSGLKAAIIQGLSAEASRTANEALSSEAPLDVIERQIIPALDAVGKEFEQGDAFLPQLLMSAQAAKAAFEEIKKLMPPSDVQGPSVVLATVQGDIHDIGKNIVGTLLGNYGFNVVDLGKDVSPEEIAGAVQAGGIKLAGLSALMPTTLQAMKETVDMIKKQSPECRVVVGGAVLNAEYADSIGADSYAKSAIDTVRYARSTLL